MEAIKVTEKMIADWKAAMKKEPSPRLFREVSQAFKAAVATTKGEGGSQCRYKVADSSGRIFVILTKYIWTHNGIVLKGSATMLLLVFHSKMAHGYNDQSLVYNISRFNS